MVEWEDIVFRQGSFSCVLFNHGHILVINEGHGFDVHTSPTEQRIVLRDLAAGDLVEP